MTRIDTVSKIMQLKDYKKEELETEVRRIREMIKKEEAQLAGIEKKFEEVSTSYREKMNSHALRSHDMELYSTCFGRLLDDIDRQRKQVASKIAELNRKQEALIEAHREKKLLEKMHGKILGEETRKKDREEQKNMDFLYLSDKARRK